MMTKYYTVYWDFDFLIYLMFNFTYINSLNQNRKKKFFQKFALTVQQKKLLKFAIPATKTKI